MYELTINTNFAAAHNLRHYKGSCERLHGHNYEVEIAITSKSTDKLGMVIDFKKVKTILKKTLSEFDHHYLNELKWFKKENPSAEKIAETLYNLLAKRFGKGITLSYVKVWESADCAAKYSTSSE